MRRINPTKAAMTVGAVVGFWHLIWVTLVGIGWAQPVLDFILRLHFVQIRFALAPFAADTALELVILTFAVGALFGLMFAVIWNWLTLESAPAWARDSMPLGGGVTTQLPD